MYYEHEFAVFHTSFPDQPHRVGFKTIGEAEQWIADTIRYGTNPGSFYVRYRTLSPWQDFSILTPEQLRILRFDNS